MEGQPVPPFSTLTGGVEAFLERSRMGLFAAHDRLGIEGPGDNGATAMVEVRQVLDKVRLGFELQDGIGLTGKKGDQAPR